jgi:hypothetical protein
MHHRLDHFERFTQTLRRIVLVRGHAMSDLGLKRFSTLKRKTPLMRKTPMKRSGFLRMDHSKEHVTKKTMKSRGMKGRAPTAAELVFMNAIAGLGCIACAKDGHVNPWISLHHIVGRTAPNAHMLVLPLCAGHHQDGTGIDPSLIAVHPYKARFEARYGTQMELLAECMAMIGWNKQSEAA